MFARPHRLGELFLALGVLSAALRAFGSDAYLIDTWRFDDDLPRDGIIAIAQGKDGYLWVSSRYGLARFDGVHFANVTALTGAQFLGYHYASLGTDRLGTVWIGTPGQGLVRWSHGALLPCLKAGNPVFGPVLAGLTNAQGRALAITPDARVLGWSNGVPELLADASRWGDVVPNTICQTRAGDLCFITYQHKLIRVSGSSVRELLYGSGEERRNWIALQSDSGGQLWAGTQREVGRLNGDAFEPIPSPTSQPLPVDDVIALPEAESGGIRRTPNASRKPSLREARTARRGRTGLWVIAQGRAWLLQQGRWITNILFEPSAGRYETSPRIADREGHLWFTTTKAVIARADSNGGLTILSTDDGLPAGRIAALCEDQEGSIWAGIEHAGLARLRPRSFTVLGTRDSAKAPLVWAVLEDAAGAIWLGTENDGLQRWQDNHLTQFNLGNNDLPGSIYSLCLDRKGELWAGSGENRVFRFDNGKFSTLWENSDPAWNKLIYAIFEDHAGRMWFGTGMGLFCFVNGKAFRVSGNGFEVGVVHAITEDASGRLWIGMSGTGVGLARLEGESLVPAGAREGFAGEAVFGLCALPKGGVWFGAGGRGLWHYQDSQFREYTSRDGLADDRIYSVAPDGSGNLWLGSPSGIMRVTGDSIGRFDSGQARALDCLQFNRTDGLPTRECSGGTQPVISRARDGRLLFALTEGAVALAPARLHLNPQRPPVIIEEVLVNGAPAPNTGALRLNPGRCVIEFHFTATSLVAPSKVRFQHRLEGVDSQWQSGSSRTALYALSSPGQYRFRVRACNNDGVWNETGASLAVVIPPHLWETWWFQVAALLGVFLSVGGAIRFVERRKLDRKVRDLEMQRTVAQERARIARDIHDELGASLTEIGLLSEFAQRSTTSSEQVRIDVQKIARKARGSTRALDEIVWALNPRHDSVEGFVAYASAYAEEQLSLADIRCRVAAASPLPSLPLRADIRHHLFLVFKEAISNVLKHAKASEVQVRFLPEDGRLQVWITDNGCGFDSAAGRPGGNGLVNMKERLAAVGAAFQLESAPGRGTSWKFVIPLE